MTSVTGTYTKKQFTETILSEDWKYRINLSKVVNIHRTDAF